MMPITHLFQKIEPDINSSKRIQELLNVELPEDYCRFLEIYGAIDDVSKPVYGSWKKDEGLDIPSVIGYTRILRKSISLPKEFIAISSDGNDEILLNTENGYIYRWYENMHKILPVMELDSFKDYLKELGHPL